jgi:hypothetical protein
MRRRKIIGTAAAGLALAVLSAASSDAPGKTAETGAPGPKNVSAVSSGKPYRNDYFDNFYAIASGGPSALWAVGNSGRIIHSGDGGTSWAIQQSPTRENLNAVSFVDSRSGWAGGNGGTIIHTADGGSTWELQNTRTKHPIFRIQFLTEKTGYACGYFGLFLRTADGGKTWENKSIGEDVALRGMCFLNEKIGYIDRKSVV